MIEFPAGLPQVFPTVVHMLQDAAAKAPAATALVCGDERLSYAEYLRCVAGFARELQGCGARGQRVAMVLGNSIDIAVASFGILAAGAQAVPLNPGYTRRELDYLLADAEPMVVVYDAAVRAVVEPLAQRLGIATTVMVGEGGRRLTAWRDDAAAELPRPLPAATDLASLQYTGGTTGRPKGANLLHGRVSLNVSQREALLPTRKDGERILCVTPLFHVYAVAMCLHLAAYCRASLIILPRFKPELILAAAERERATILVGSPTVFTGLMANERFARTDFSSLRICYSGASALPEEVLRRWQEATGCSVLEGFGQSESGPVVAFNPEHGVRKPGAVGLPTPGTEIQIVDPEHPDRVLAPGGIGEIRVRGPQLMIGYRNMPDETAQTLRDGWLYTGDIGEIDADGYLFIRDRKKDMVNVGGYNVYPREIEEVLYQHPDIQEAAVVGRSDSFYGEAVKAFVVPVAGRTLTAEDLQRHCAAQLVKYKIPNDIVFLDDLPRTSVGKIDKKVLKEHV